MPEAPTIQERPVFIAGASGLLGSALQRVLAASNIGPLLTPAHGDLDLTDRTAVETFFATHQPRLVFLAAARVGGIEANRTQPVRFLLDNLAISTHVIDASRRHGVERLLFFSSNCAYPRDSVQPIRESSFLTGPLEPTNAAFATAKIAAVELCRGCNQQYGTRFLALAPTGLYGPGDTYDPARSHVTAAMIRRMHEARIAGANEVVIWGSGTPRREMLYSDDCARAGMLLASLPDEAFDAVIAAQTYPLINIGGGTELSILELAQQVARIVGYTGQITTDPSRPDGMPRKLLDNRRLEALGWRAEIDLDEGLRRAYADYLARYGGP